MLATSLTTLKQAFDILSEIVDGYRVIKVPAAKRLLQELGVLPQAVTERDTQMAFALMLQAQTNARSPAAR
jgi:hypothetical protein